MGKQHSYYEPTAILIPVGTQVKVKDGAFDYMTYQRYRDVRGLEGTIIESTPADNFVTRHMYVIEISGRGDFGVWREDFDVIDR